MLHMISARCVARNLHTIGPMPLERTCWRWFTAQCGGCKKSRIAPLNVIIINNTQYQQIRSSMTKNSKRQRKLEDFGGGLLLSEEGYSLKQNIIRQYRKNVVRKFCW